MKPVFTVRATVRAARRARQVRILRGLRAKSGSGSDQILIEGVVVATHKLDCPPSQYPRDNPEGWDVYATARQDRNASQDPETGMLYKRDENGMEIVDGPATRSPRRCCVSPRSATATLRATASSMPAP